MEKVESSNSKVYLNLLILNATIKKYFCVHSTIFLVSG